MSSQDYYILLLDSVRLVDGDSPFDGRVEYAFSDSAWLLMCDSYFHINVAKTVCRMLGYPVTNVTLKANITVEEEDTWIRCDDDDEDIFLQCGWVIWPKYECKPEESLGISCNGNVRLTNGTYDLNGNLETLKDGEMITLCDYMADSHIAEVVCRQLGRLTDTSTVTIGSFFGNGEPSNYYVKCDGSESSLEKCRMFEYTGSDSCGAEHVLGVDCNATKYDIEPPDIEQFRSEGGTVDVIYLNIAGYWTEQIPEYESPEFEQFQNIASVVCYQLGYSRYSPKLSLAQNTRKLTNPIVLSKQLQCTGSEVSLSTCAILNSFHDNDDMSTSTEVVIKCKPNIRLFQGKTYNEYPDSGMLFIQNDTSEVLHPLADVHMDYKAAQVACRELGFRGSSVEIRLVSDKDFGVLHHALKVDFVCSGDEERLRDCQSKTSDVVKSDALVWLDCNYQGTLAVYVQPSIPPIFFAREELRGIDIHFCTTKSDLDDITAGVICHQAGFTKYGATFTRIVTSNYNHSSYSIVEDISRFRCLGTEESVNQCPRYGDPPKREDCISDVSIQCQGTEECASEWKKGSKTHIFCHSYVCSGNVCRSLPPTNCSLDDGYACTTSLTMERKFASSPIEPTVLSGMCEQNCEPLIEMQYIFLRSRECCYDDFCNSNTSGVRLSGYVRLREGIQTGEGLVQIQTNMNWVQNDWMYVKYDPGLSNTVVTAMCAEGGHLLSSAVTRNPDLYTERAANYTCLKLNVDKCSSGVRLTECVETTEQCSSGKRLRISCSARSPVRLQDGGASYQGRVEIYHKGLWGTVCSKRSSSSLSAVICRSLGYNTLCSSDTNRNKRVRFREGQGPIHFMDVNCTGMETHIQQCSYNIVKENSDCTHEDDLGVLCDEKNTESVQSDWQEVIETSTNTVNSEPYTKPLAIYEDFFQSTSNETIACYTGSCVSASDCLRVLWKGKVHICKTKGYTQCFINVDFRAKSNEKSIEFGCMSSCKAGRLYFDPLLQSSTTQHCCQTSHCNNILMIEDALHKQETDHDVFKNESVVFSNNSDIYSSGGNKHDYLLLSSLMSFLLQIITA